MMEFFFDILKSEKFYSYEKTSKSFNQLEQACGLSWLLQHQTNKGKIKTDKIDAEKLVTFQFSLNRKPSYVQEALYLELHDLSRFYQNLTEDIVYGKTNLWKTCDLLNR